MKLEFSRSFFFSKYTQISYLVKIRPVGVELFHAETRMDGRTYMTKLAVAFRNFANAPENTRHCTHLNKQVSVDFSDSKVVTLDIRISAYYNPIHILRTFS